MFACLKDIVEAERKNDLTMNSSAIGNDLLPLPDLPNSFAINSFSARRQQIDSSQLFLCQDLTGHTDYIYTMEFSEDGALLGTGGRDKTVRLWSLNQGLGEWNSTEMEMKHDDGVSCLTFSPDNQRIFSGSFDKKISIHDTNTQVSVFECIQLFYFQMFDSNFLRE